MQNSHNVARIDEYRNRFRAIKHRVNARVLVARANLAERLLPTGTGGELATVSTFPRPSVAETLGREAAQWVHAHRAETEPVDVPENTVLVFADDALQQWMGQTLDTLGWSVTAPVLAQEGWVPARGENLETGQPAVTYTTPSRTFVNTHARRTDPATAKKAGTVAAANQSITANSHLGQLLLTYADRHVNRPGVGYTAAEAVTAAGLLTDGATGSPWRRVTDLRDHGLLTCLLDPTAQRVVRKNDSNTDGQVLVITPLGLNAAAALRALIDHGYPDYPLAFDGPTEPALFEDLPATLAKIDAFPVAHPQAS